MDSVLPLHPVEEFVLPKHLTFAQLCNGDLLILRVGDSVGLKLVLAVSFLGEVFDDLLKNGY